MTRSEMIKILQKVYDLDVKMDEAIDKRDRAIDRNDAKTAAICESYHTNLSFEFSGMQAIIKALGYKLEDDGFCWRLVPENA